MAAQLRCAVVLSAGDRRPDFTDFRLHNPSDKRLTEHRAPLQHERGRDAIEVG